MSSCTGVLWWAGVLAGFISVSSVCGAQDHASSSAQNHPQATQQPVLDVTSMDTSVDPCVDFFAYSCNGWIKRNPIPPDQSSWTAYAKLQDENQIELRGILDTAAAETGERPAYRQKIGDYYASCRDEKAIDTLGARPLQAAMAKIEAIQSKKDLSDAVGGLASQFVLFNFRSDQDYKNSAEVIAEADQGGLGLPDRDYYFKDDAKSVELRKAYVAHVQKMLELLGHTSGAAAAEADAVLRIETSLAKASLTRVERRDPQLLYHRMTSAQLQTLSPAFPWKIYMTKVGLPSVDSLNVATPEFFKGMNAAIEKESIASWQAYLRWHLANANAEFLSTPFVNEDFAFYGK